MTMQSQRGGGDIAPIYPQPGCRGKWVASPTFRSTNPPWNTCYPLYRRVGGPWGRSADRPARSESLYRLRTPGHLRAVVALTAWFYLFRLSVDLNFECDRCTPLSNHLASRVYLFLPTNQPCNTYRCIQSTYPQCTPFCARVLKWTSNRAVHCTKYRWCHVNSPVLFILVLTVSDSNVLHLFWMMTVGFFRE